MHRLFSKLEKVRVNRNRAYQFDRQIRDLESERSDLNDQYESAVQERQQSELRLNNDVERIEKQAKEIERERNAAKARLDQQIDTINAEIDNLRNAADFLRHTDRRFCKDDEIDAPFFRDMDHMYAEQDSLEQHRSNATKTRDAKVEHLKNPTRAVKTGFRSAAMGSPKRPGLGLSEGNSHRGSKRRRASGRSQGSNLVEDIEKIEKICHARKSQAVVGSLVQRIRHPRCTNFRAGRLFGIGSMGEISIRRVDAIVRMGAGR